MLIDEFIVISSEMVLLMKYYISIDLVIDVLDEKPVIAIYESIGA